MSSKKDSCLYRSASVHDNNRYCKFVKADVAKRRLEYLKHSLNIVPDALSRMHDDDIVCYFLLVEMIDLDISPLLIN